MDGAYAAVAGNPFTPFLKVAFAGAFVIGIMLLVTGSVRLFRERDAPLRARARSLAILVLGLVVVSAPAAIRYVSLDAPSVSRPAADRMAF